MNSENTIIEHLSQTLNATRAELKSVANIATDREFDALMAEAIQGCSQLRVKDAGTYSEWYYLASTTTSAPLRTCFERQHDNHRLHV